MLFRFKCLYLTSRIFNSSSKSNRIFFCNRASSKQSILSQPRPLCHWPLSPEVGWLCPCCRPKSGGWSYSLRWDGQQTNWSLPWASRFRHQRCSTEPWHGQCRWNILLFLSQGWQDRRMGFYWCLHWQCCLECGTTWTVHVIICSPYCLKIVCYIWTLKMINYGVLLRHIQHLLMTHTFLPLWLLNFWVHLGPVF